METHKVEFEVNDMVYFFEISQLGQVSFSELQPNHNDLGTPRQACTNRPTSHAVRVFLEAERLLLRWIDRSKPGQFSLERVRLAENSKRSLYDKILDRVLRKTLGAYSLNVKVSIAPISESSALGADPQLPCVPSYTFDRMC